MVHVQAILFASLSASLLSAFLAMLGKQWLNRYASIDMRGSVIERSQNRQRKLDGIVTWYFDAVMESLPLMLQVALLLLGCALSRYLWDSYTTVASVVLGVASLGILFYFLIVVAGSASGSCPYQTPGSRMVRYLGPKIWSILRGATRSSRVIKIIKKDSAYHYPWWSRRNIGPFSRLLVWGVPCALALDAYRLSRVMVWIPAKILSRTYGVVRGAYNGLRASSSTPDNQVVTFDLRCISWILQTSLDKPVHLSTLRYLATMAELTHLDPILVVNCFEIFIGCINVNNGRVAIVQGLEQLATVAAGCFLRTFLHFSTMNPTSNILANLRRRYNKIFPFETDFRGLPFCHTMTKLHSLFTEQWSPIYMMWYDYRPPTQELVPFAGIWSRLLRQNINKHRMGKYPVGSSASPSLSYPPIPRPQGPLLPIAWSSSQSTWVVIVRVPLPCRIGKFESDKYSLF